MAGLRLLPLLVLLAACDTSSKVADKVGDTVMEHRAMAERLALRGAWPAATEHLKSAEEDKSVNFYEASAIAARLHQMEAQYKEDQKEKDDFN